MPVGYELWRQFNGFPPIVGMTEPTKGGEARSDSKSSSSEQKDTP